VAIYLHHVLLNFPLALSIAAAVGYIVGWLKKSAQLQTWARGLTYAAACLAILAAAAGLLSAAHVVASGGDPTLVDRHRNAGLLAVVTLLASAATSWRIGVKGNRPEPRSWPATLAAGAALTAAIAVGAAGHFGGTLVHPGLGPFSKEEHAHGGATKEQGAHGPTASASASAGHHAEKGGAGHDKQAGESESGEGKDQQRHKDAPGHDMGASGRASAEAPKGKAASEHEMGAGDQRAQGGQPKGSMAHDGHNAGARRAARFAPPPGRRAPMNSIPRPDATAAPASSIEPSRPLPEPASTRPSMPESDNAAPGANSSAGPGGHAGH
jgi:uncharacterized membrane protein